MGVDKSPKSNASPSVAIVIKSIVSCLLGFAPPAKTPLTAFAEVEGYLVVRVKSPNSAAFPNVEIVTNCILLVKSLAGDSYPEAVIPLVGLERE